MVRYRTGFLTLGLLAALLAVPATSTYAEHQTPLLTASDGTCHLSTHELEEVELGGGSNWPWQETQTAVQTLEDCSDQLHLTRKLVVKLDAADLTAASTDLPSKLARVIQHMTNLEKVALSVYEGYYQQAFQDAHLELRSVRDLEVSKDSLWFIPMCPNIVSLSLSAQGPLWYDVNDGKSGAYFLGYAFGMTSLRNLSIEADWTSDNHPVLEEPLPHITSLSIVGTGTGMYFDESALILKQMPSVTSLHLTKNFVHRNCDLADVQCGHNYVDEPQQRHRADLASDETQFTAAGKILKTLPELKELSIDDKRFKRLTSKPSLRKMWQLLKELDETGVASMYVPASCEEYAKQDLELACSLHAKGPLKSEGVVLDFSGLLFAVRKFSCVRRETMPPVCEPFLVDVSGNQARQSNPRGLTKGGSMIECLISAFGSSEINTKAFREYVVEAKAICPAMRDLR